MRTTRPSWFQESELSARDEGEEFTPEARCGPSDRGFTYITTRESIVVLEAAFYFAPHLVQGINSQNPSKIREAKDFVGGRARERYSWSCENLE